MSRRNSERREAGGTRPSRWSQILLYIAATLMIAVGGGVLLLQWLISSAGSEISGEILPELESADRIEAVPGALAGWNVLLVTLDTTRADHLSAYRNRSIETPTLERLAREGLLFANAVTPVPATLPAHASLMTGLYPFRHGVRANGTHRLEDRQVTLAEVLRGHGFRTAAAISAYVLDSSFGLAQGFDVYYDDLTRGTRYSPQMFRERAAELTNEPVFEWLEGQGNEPFFLWVHYFDAHAPYLAPEPFRSKYPASPYDGEIAYADHQLGRLLERLVEIGVRERTLVVIAADHGEGFGEHGEQTHSLLIHDATMRVPLILHAPAVLPQGRVVRGQASLVDVMPTILDLLGIGPPSEVDGVSLLRPPLPGLRSCYIETLSTMTLHGWAPLYGVRREDYKLVVAPRPELYDLRADPSELENLYERRPDIVTELRGALAEITGQASLVTAMDSSNFELDEEARAALAALGYVSSRGRGALDRGSSMDPKDGVLHWESVQKGVHLRNAGDLKAAIQILELAVEEVPRDVFALQTLAGAYQAQGRFEDALEIARAAEELQPDDPTLLLGVAALHTRLLDLDRAEEKVRRVLELQADHSGAYVQLAEIARLRRDGDEALQLLKRALEVDRGSRKAQILSRLSDLYLRRGDPGAARDALLRALEIDAFNGEAHAGLAEILIDEGNESNAIDHLQQALRFNPAQPRALTVLCGVKSQRGELDAAIEACERALEITPILGPAHANLGLAYRRKGDFEKAERVYRNGIERAPRYDALHLNLAQLLLRQGQVEEAVAEFEAAVKLNPRNSVALANLGVYHMKASRVERAQRFFVAALRAQPDYALPHLQLGVLLLEQNEFERGMSHLERSLEIDPTQPDSELIRFQLDSFEAAAADRPPE